MSLESFPKPPYSVASVKIEGGRAGGHPAKYALLLNAIACQGARANAGVQ